MNDSVLKTLTVSFLVCLFCSLVVSYAAVSLGICKILISSMTKESRYLKQLQFIIQTNLLNLNLLVLHQNL